MCNMCSCLFRCKLTLSSLISIHLRQRKNETKSIRINWTFARLHLHTYRSVTRGCVKRRFRIIGASFVFQKKMVSILILLHDFHCDKDPAANRLYQTFVKLRKWCVSVRRNFFHHSAQCVCVFRGCTCVWNEILL